MANETVFVILPFVKMRGRLKAQQAERAKSAEAAKLRAERLASVRAGAVAISRTGDADTGDLDHAEVLAKFGEVPDELDEFLA